MDPYVFPRHLPESVPFQERCMTWNLPHENITTTTGSLWMSRLWKTVLGPYAASHQIGDQF